MRCLLLQEDDPDAAMANFRECIKRVNTGAWYDRFLHTDFPLFYRNDALEQTLGEVEKLLGLISSK